MTRFIPLIVLLVLFGVLAVRLNSGIDPKVVETPQIGRTMPLDNKTKLKPPYLVNVFASWCEACQVEHKFFVELAARGVPVIGIAYRDKKPATEKYLKKLGNPYKDVIYDPEGKIALELGLTGVPETYGVGADGRIITHLPAPATRMKDLERLVP